MLPTDKVLYFLTGNAAGCRPVSRSLQQNYALPCVAALVIFFVVQVQSRASFRDVSSNISRELDSLCENYLLSLDTKKEIISRNDRIYQSHTAAIAEALRRSGEEAFSESTLRSLCSTFEVGNLAIITPDGRELCSAYPHAMDFSRTRFNQLKYVSVTGQRSKGFTVTVNGEEKVLYAAPLSKDRILVYIEEAYELRAATEETRLASESLRLPSSLRHRCCWCY